MNIINIIKGIELLAVELLLWIIYVPKTIYKIIKDPNWVPVYIKEELAKSEKFKVYMSPVLLFLAISVVLFVLLDSGLIIAPDYEESGGNFGQQLKGPAGLLFLALPLFFGLIIEIFRKGGITRENLLQSLYVQCYYFSPLMLSFFAYMLANQFDWENLSGELTYLGLIPLLLLMLTLLWFIIIQVKYISRELRYKKWVALGLHLICYIIIAGGLEIYYVLTPHEVNENGAGEAEYVKLKIPDQGEYRTDIWDSDYNMAADFTIAINKQATDLFIPSEKMSLVHNQVVVGSLMESLLFSMSGNKGDQVILRGSKSLLSQSDTAAGQSPFLRFEAYINPNEPLMFKYSDEGSYESTGMWEMEILQDDSGFILYVTLPRTGNYTLIISKENPNLEEGFTLGYFKQDIYGNTEKSNHGILANGTAYLGTSMLEEAPFDHWTFTGKKNEDVTLFVAPMPPQNIDLLFNVVNAKQESIVPVDRTSIANIIHAVYVILFGWLIVIGYRALFRKSEKILLSEAEPGNRAGKIVAIFALVIFLAAVLFFLG